MFDVVFTPGNIHRYRDPLRVDAARMALFNAQLRGRGILNGDSKYYLSTSLTEADIQHTLDAWDGAISIMTAR
ncbi:MAG: hypothetical protein O7G88_07600 [bacterium]|nr:hypothetical protein [bacterium]